MVLQFMHRSDAMPAETSFSLANLMHGVSLASILHVCGIARDHDDAKALLDSDGVRVAGTDQVLRGADATLTADQIGPDGLVLSANGITRRIMSFTPAEMVGQAEQVTPAGAASQDSALANPMPDDQGHRPADSADPAEGAGREQHSPNEPEAAPEG